MTVLRFPALDDLRKALAAEIVPAAVATKPVDFAIGADGAVWLAPSGSVPRATMAALTKYGVGRRAEPEISLDRTTVGWAQILPLMVVDGEAESVLFELPSAESLPKFAAEVRRLGGGRLDWHIDSERSLARVARPPYYSIARAQSSAPDRPRAFAEQSAGVWVELGYRHPLPALLAPPPEMLAFAQPPDDWRYVPEPWLIAPCASIALPAGPPPIADRSTAPAIAIRPRLLPEPLRGVAELWLLEGDAWERLRGWCRTADERLIGRLAVARVDLGDREAVLLTARSGVDAPPVIVLDAVPYRSFLKLPNLFLPVGVTLGPAIRRDIARQQYAAADRLTWLTPADDGSVRLASAPTAAFQRLDECVRYATPAAERIAALVPDEVFSYARFESTERPAPARVKPMATTAEQAGGEDKPSLWQSIYTWAKGAWSPAVPPPPAAVLPGEALPPPPAADAPTAETAKSRVAELEARLFAEVRSGRDIDDPAAWNELAAGYAAVRRPGEAALARLQALWLDDADPEAAWGWLRAEAVPLGGLGTPDDLNHWLTEQPNVATVRAVAAFALRAALEATPPKAFGRNAGAIQTLLETHEEYLPIRAAWLARTALARTTGGDSLSLARCRDRLYARLFAQGLRLDRDVPPFLRHAVADAADRLPAVRAWLEKARDAVQRWLGPRGNLATERLRSGEGLEPFGLSRDRRYTPSYADLLMAWAQARLGEEPAADALVGRSRGRLPLADPVHGWLAEALILRADEALVGDPPAPWPADLRERLDSLELTERYAIDKFRRYVRVLEPFERVSEYAAVRPTASDPLTALTDLEELGKRVTALARSVRPTPVGRLQGLPPLLEPAARAGPALLRSLLDKLVGDLESPPSDAAVWPAFAAAFRSAAAGPSPEHAGRLAVAASRAVAAHGHQAGELEELLESAVAALRRLHRPEDFSRFAAAVAGRFREGPAAGPASLRCRLHLAAGRFWLGDETAAVRTLDEARTALFVQTEPADQRERGERLSLALAYIAALGKAPVRLALGRLDELFQRLPVPTDTFNTNKFYSLAALRIIDAVVRAVADDEFTHGPVVRRWLDEDEFRVRRRIDRDLAEALKAGQRP